MLVVKRLLLGYVGEILVSCLIVSWESNLGKLYAYLNCMPTSTVCLYGVMIIPRDISLRTKFGYLPIRKIENNDQLSL